MAEILCPHLHKTIVRFRKSCKGGIIPPFSIKKKPGFPLRKPGFGPESSIVKKVVIGGM
jgi:hypothetical protein